MPACKLTPDVETDILNLVGAGNTLLHSARAAGVTASTLRNWQKQAEAGRQPYAEFWSKVDIAQARAITGAVDSVKSAAKTDWRAAKFFLEYMERRGSSPANVAKQLEEILQVVEDVLGAAEAKKVLRAIIERSGGPETGESGATLRLISAG